MMLPPQGAKNGPDSSPSPGFAAGQGNSSDRGLVPTTNRQPAQSQPTIRRWIEELEEAIVVLDEGIIVENNSRAPALFGRQAGAIQGWHLKELVTEESLMRLTLFLEYDDPEPALVLGVRQDHRAFPLQMKAVASIIADGRRLRVTSLARCGAVERPPDTTSIPPP